MRPLPACQTQSCCITASTESACLIHPHIHPSNHPLSCSKLDQTKLHILQLESLYTLLIIWLPFGAHEHKPIRGKCHYQTYASSNELMARPTGFETTPPSVASKRIYNHIGYWSTPWGELKYHLHFTTRSVALRTMSALDIFLCGWCLRVNGYCPSSQRKRL